MTGRAHPEAPDPEAPDARTDLFLSLTPDRVLEAVEAAGLPTRPLCYPLNSFENRVYEVELEDRSRIIAKFYRPGRWSRQQIEEEHVFLADLEAAEIPVGTALTFPDGDTIAKTGHIYYSIFERRGGRSPDEPSEALAERLGMLAGRLHAVGAERPAPHRLRLDADTYIRDNLVWLEAHEVIPAHLEDRYMDTAKRIADHLDRGLEGLDTHRIHGDLHLGNVLERDERLSLVDFDDMMVGPPVQDVWLAIPGRDEETRRRRDAFLTGYEQFRLFDDRTLRLIEPLRALRLIHYATWLARRWHDPIFPANWPQFGSEEYWREEIEALEEQLRWTEAAENAPASSAEGRGFSAVPGPKETEELTNKDYFWDWDDD